MSPPLETRGPAFARRAGWDLARSPFARAVETARGEGRVRIDLAESIPARCGLAEPGRALARALADLAGDPGVAEYAPDPRGDPEARRAIARYLASRGALVAPEHVVLSAGTSEGYAHLFRLLADPGERVLVPRPGYPLFDFLAELEGVEAACYPLALDAGSARWRIDWDALEREASERTRALLVVHPHNPTGALVAPDDLERARSLCAERGIALISDEVFGDYLFAERSEPRSALASAGAALEFALSGASKVLALPQLKVAWIVAAGPARVRDEALARLEVIADTYLSVSPLAQRTLPALLAERERLQAPILARVRANRLRLAAALDGSASLAPLPAEGGWSAIVRGTFDDEELALRLLEQEGVLVHPGYLFDLPPHHLVVSLLAEPTGFAEGSRALRASAAR